MCARIAYMETTKKESGLKRGLETHILKDIGISSVKRSKNIILGANLNAVLKINIGADVNG